MPFRFRSKSRICQKRTFKKIYESGFCLKSPYAFFYYLHSEGHFFRLGLTVSKIVGNAVVCSRIKRCYRESFRTSSLRSTFPPIDLVVSVRASAHFKNNKKLSEDFEKNLKNIKKNIL